MTTWEVMHTFGPDYKAIFVGDASMSPYELTHPGGSVEHMNQEPGALWLKRMSDHFRRTIWLNPTKEDYWRYTRSIAMVEEILEGHMYPLTLDGLDRAIRELNT